MDIDAILEWNDPQVRCSDVLARLVALSVDHRAVQADPRIGALWNDARRALVDIGHSRKGFGRA